MYKIDFSRSAYKQLRKLPIDTHGRVFNGIGTLMGDPLTTTLDTTKLTDRDGYRLRVGDYRILYEIDHTEQIIYIESIVHRREAY